jgi:hypothetical protein
LGAGVDAGFSNQAKYSSAPAFALQVPDEVVDLLGRLGREGLLHQDLLALAAGVGLDELAQLPEPPRVSR